MSQTIANFNSTWIDELIKGRRSIKAFKPSPIAPEEIVELLNVAKWAPNHHLTEPWRFLLFAEKGKDTFVQAFLDSQSNKYGEVTEAVKRKAEYFRQIPLHLVVVMAEDPRQKVWDEDHCAVSALIQNFQLAAWARGIGMIWRSNDWIYHPTFREALGVKPGEKVVATLMIGYPEHTPAPRPRTDMNELVEIINEPPF